MIRPADLKRTIERMGNRFPWYSPMLPSGRTDQTSTEQWSQLPLITAGILETHYYTADNPLAAGEGMNLYRTSGTSSNRRKAIFYSPADEEAYLQIKREVLGLILGGRYRTAIADVGTGHAEATAVQVFRELGMEVDSLSFRLPIERHIERLAEFRPEVLYTMPSLLDRILQASGDPAAFGIRHVILVGEMAAPSWIRSAARRLSIGTEQITDTYGSIEIGTIAYYSHRHGRYLLAEGLFAEGVGTEVLGDGLEPLSAAEERVLVLTSACRDSFPAIRYVTYDVVRDLRWIVVDGKPRQSFHSLVKRIGPELKHGEKISLYDIENVVLEHLPEASIRVKVAGNALSVQVCGPEAEPQTLEKIRHDLERRIPEIGIMIQSRILGEIQVLQGVFDDSLARRSIKNKTVSYEQGGTA
ncbi:CoF synthetase [Paenibacillus nasutitermitis]|uniref:CoF synthetase n=1 Tax=Paenibacillus nasutitermitis TaxID=1652958 RepID=A0A917E2Q7_9BACL|nr:CoF synthetase [Paenibacillus nasutitermitis]GGD97790.1 hypothetical protein GCM10010911_65710 [Paenibacillus nasutitermitis]